MSDAIIICILIIFIIVGISSTVKHFKGEGGCCGGGSYIKVKRKKPKQVIKQRTVMIEGMTCEHCRARVESRLNELDGVSAKVNLKKKIAVVSMEKDIAARNSQEFPEHPQNEQEAIADIYRRMDEIQENLAYERRQRKKLAEQIPSKESI